MAQNNYSFKDLVATSQRWHPKWDIVDHQYWALSKKQYHGAYSAAMFGVMSGSMRTGDSLAKIRVPVLLLKADAPPRSSRSPPGDSKRDAESQTRPIYRGDILWDKGRFIVRSGKTEHHDGHDQRVTPLFPELQPILAEAFDAAAPGAVHVIARTRNSESNLRTQMTRIVELAGLEIWPKVFQNLRSTRATELANQYPQHVAAAWLGHSIRIAKTHYWQVTDEHFSQAVEGSKIAAPFAARDENAAHLLRKSAATSCEEL